MVDYQPTDYLEPQLELADAGNMAPPDFHRCIFNESPNIESY